VHPTCPSALASTQLFLNRVRPLVTIVFLRFTRFANPPAAAEELFAAFAGLLLVRVVPLVEWTLDFRGRGWTVTVRELECLPGAGDGLSDCGRSGWGGGRCVRGGGGAHWRQ
jgi:hypothetical protein